MELNQIWLRERIFGRSAWVASRASVWLMSFAGRLRRLPDIQTKSYLNAVAINLRVSEFWQSPPPPRMYIIRSFRTLLSAAIQRLEICLYNALEQARKLQLPAKATAIVQCRHHRFTINFNGNFLQEFPYNCHPTRCARQSSKIFTGKSNFFRRCSFCVFARSFFCVWGKITFYLEVRNSSDVVRREKVDISIRYIRQRRTHNIFLSLSEWKQPGQKNNECGLLSNVPSLVLVTSARLVRAGRKHFRIYAQHHRR